MTDLQKVFYAGLVHRWHTNPHLAGTADRLNGHQARVARIIYALWPEAHLVLIIAALTHDDGEFITGDIPAPCCKTKAQAYAEGEAYHSIWGMEFPALSTVHQQRLHFADKLDAYMWAKHHAPHIMDDPEWVTARRYLFEQAEALGVEVAL